LPRGGLCVVITDTAIGFRLVCRPVNLILAQELLALRTRPGPS
jgi:hypothetical protein